MNGELVQIGSGRAKAKHGPLRLVGVLTFGSLFSGLAIVGAYEATLPRITANQAAALRRAVFEVVPGAEQLERLVWKDGKLGPAGGNATTDPAIYAAYAGDGRFLGWAIPGEGAGYQDTIRLLYGFDPARRHIIGMQVVESRETPGLGDRIYKDKTFVSAFRDLAIEPKVELVKGGASAPNQVDGLTGATISSSSVVRILNTANAEWSPRLPAPGSEPTLGAGGKETP